jgi:hypothetical protein
MLPLICVILILFGALVIGCSFLLSNDEPQLGMYSYTHKAHYHGPAVRVIPIWVDKNFGQADRLQIDAAVGQWNYALNGYIILRVVDNSFDMEIDKIQECRRRNGWLFMRINGDNSMVPIQKPNQGRTLGFANKVGGNHLYLVRERMDNEAVFGVTMHEIGHLLGAEHVGNRLMYKHFSRARFQCVDLDSLEAVAHYQGISADDLNYCMDKGVTKTPSSSKDEVSDCPVELDH